MNEEQILRTGFRQDKGLCETLSTQSKQGRDRAAAGLFPFTGRLQFSIHSFVPLTPALLDPGQRTRPRFKEKNPTLQLKSCLVSFLLSSPNFKRLKSWF